MLFGIALVWNKQQAKKRQAVMAEDRWERSQVLHGTLRPCLNYAFLRILILYQRKRGWVFFQNKLKTLVAAAPGEGVFPILCTNTIPPFQNVYKTNQSMFFKSTNPAFQRAIILDAFFRAPYLE